ncbi:MAG: hypothetical protein HY816_01730 [Candidatus Wallbacteria bacterium]|nr:hypothetical protein [Candidatus Wallbacteria bacterium]
MGVDIMWKRGGYPYRPAKFPSREMLEELEERKLAPYRTMTPEERGRDLVSVCRTAMSLTMCHPAPARSLALEEPLPESTMRLWRRLRAHYEWRPPS